MTVIQSFEHLPKKIAEQKNNSIGTIALGAVFNLLARERKATQADKALIDNKPKVIPRRSDAGEHVFVFSMGLMQDPGRFSERIGPLVDQFGPSYYVKRTNNDAANKAARLEIVNQERGRQVVVFGNSKGGKDEVREMTDPDYMTEHGQIDWLTLHSSPLSRSHIRKGGRIAMLGGLLLPETHSVAVEFAKKQQEKAREQGERFVRALSVASFYEARAELPVLLDDLPTDGSIAVGLNPVNVKRITMVSSPYDRLVDMKASYEWLKAQTGRSDIEFEVDETLEHGSHAGFTDRPESQMQVFEKYAAGELEARILQQI
jgi:hypothetical protein